MYNVGTVTTTANSTKLIGMGTKWKENINLVLPMQMIQIQIGNTVHNNSIHSIQSNTELTLNFPIPTAQTGAKYVIFTTTMDSISAAANAIVAMNSSNVQFSDIQNRIMTESGVIDVKLPDGTVRKTRTEAERDKQLDGKFDKAGGTITGALTSTGNITSNGDVIQVINMKNNQAIQLDASNDGLVRINSRQSGGTTLNHAFPSSGGTLYSTGNTTKDSNGNLKAASPIVKLFADHIELNEESEGVEMEHIGTGHYLIKGVVGFNSDGAWGINNGFVIPQDHNGKNMVLIDYEVKPDGDIEVFVFHQQNTDLPERFQNKRIKHIDKDGNPVYYENYEPCDVPESRWIDMRVEMPVNSIYNLKQAEAAKLASYQQQLETLELNK
ncbi:phage tail fiber protein [Providencia stuartii]|uniref:phage tail fiber protein n=1 Tax=Providencia stuartii TaxID=588 RepID=UPI00332067CD